MRLILRCLQQIRIFFSTLEQAKEMESTRAPAAVSRHLDHRLPWRSPFRSHGAPAVALLIHQIQVQPWSCRKAGEERGRQY